jgi:site-specific recombinase XerD
VTNEQTELPLDRPSHDPAVVGKVASTVAPARRSEATMRAYRRDWQDFTAWCQADGHQALPAEPDVIAAYLVAQAAEGHKPSTVARRAAAIGATHRDAGHLNPCTADVVRSTVAAVKAVGADTDSTIPLTVPELRRMVGACNPATLIGSRDAALLLVGFAGGYIRSELVAIDLDHLHRHRDGHLTIAGTTPRRLAPGGRAVTCPVRALDRWIEIAGISDGPVFRPISRDDTVVASRLSDRAVARVVARCAERAGFPPGRHVAAHSLRAGFIHAALAAGVPEREVARHVGLAPAGTALTGYARRSGQAPVGPASSIDVGL